jgi:hypothetical protein
VPQACLEYATGSGAGVPPDCAGSCRHPMSPEVSFGRVARYIINVLEFLVSNGTFHSIKIMWWFITQSVTTGHIYSNDL